MEVAAFFGVRKVLKLEESNPRAEMKLDNHFSQCFNRLVENVLGVMGIGLGLGGDFLLLDTHFEFGQ